MNMNRSQPLTKPLRNSPPCLALSCCLAFILWDAPAAFGRGGAGAGAAAAGGEVVGGAAGEAGAGHGGDCARATGRAPEQKAARLLQEAVAKRFRQSWPIVREGEEQPAHKTLVMLGQRTTCARLDELCRKQGIELSETSPGFDGYVIVPVPEGDRLLVVVGGCNARGVEYGQDTLFQMLRGSGED